MNILSLFSHPVPKLYNVLYSVEHNRLDALKAISFCPNQSIQ